MSIILTRFQKSIIINRNFAESLATELRSISFSQGTILLVANEILLDPNYEFNYKEDNVVKFPGRYDLILVTDRFDSRGAKIDLTGPTGQQGRQGESGCTAFPNEPCPESGRLGSPGKIGVKGDPGLEGKNIKTYISEVENMKIISNGGGGGKGGKGGQGGNGERLPVGGMQLKGGNGGPGADGGDGGKAGKITVLFFTKPAGFNIIDHLTSSGGAGGDPGDGGEPGQGGGNSPAVRGPPGQHRGNNGTSSEPEVVGKSWKEFWKSVIVELGIPTS
jgi:hypothetical protein